MSKKNKAKKTLILASTSPRRHALLAQTGLVFKAIGGDYEEDMTLPLSPRALAKTLSRGKAESVAKKHTNAVVIGADTFIVFRGQVIGKPKTPAKARERLRALRGRSHSVITGYTIIDTKTGQSVSRAIETKIYMRKYTDAEIGAYIRTGEPMERAGGYAVQEIGGSLIKRIEGDFFNVIGLPIFNVLADLKKFGVKVF